MPTMEESTKSAWLSEAAVPTPLKTPTDVAPALVAESISWLLSPTIMISDGSIMRSAAIDSIGSADGLLPRPSSPHTIASSAIGIAMGLPVHFPCL